MSLSAGCVGKAVGRFAHPVGRAFPIMSCHQPPDVLCIGGLAVIRKEAWPFCGTSSGVRLCWELEEPEGPTEPTGLGQDNGSLFSSVKEPSSLQGSPLGPLGHNFSQLSPTARPSVERTAAKVFMLSDRVGRCRTRRPLCGVAPALQGYLAHKKQRLPGTQQ